MSLANCITKLNAGKAVFSETDIKDIRALVNQNMGKMTQAEAEKFAVQSLLDDALADQQMVMELVREGMGLPALKAKGHPALNQTGDLFAQKMNPIKIDAKLTGKDAEIQARFRAWVWENLDEAIAQYQKANGNVLNVDEARKLSPDYHADADSRSLYSSAVHEPASWLIKQIYDRELAKPTPEGVKQKVVFTAGGTGAGKSTSIKEIPALLEKVSTAQIVFDTNMNGFESANKKIKQALNAGFDVEVIYVYRDPLDALHGALGRAMNPKSESYGRTIPLESHVATHIGSSKAVRNLAEEHKDNRKVAFHGINNTLGKGNSQQVELAKLPVLAHNSIDLEVYREAVRKEHREKRITDAVLEGTLGKPALGVENAGTSDGGSSGSGAQAHPDVKSGIRSVLTRNQGRDQQPAASQSVGDQHENRPVGDGSNEGKSSATAGGTASERKSGSVHPGEIGRNIVGNRLPLNDDRQEAGVRPDAGLQQAGGNTQLGNASGKGNRAGRDAGVPTGRDIPAKSGLNYHFTDADLTYSGSWQVKARQNVEAVELVKKLESEGRKATRAEQSILAKFIGWGASDIRNNIFGAQLDEQLEALAKYDEAITNLGSKPYLTNSNYREYQAAFAVLHAKNPALSWYTAGNITKAMLDAAKPDQSARKWGELRDRLKAVMTDEEWKTAERSTQYAHFTGKDVVGEMWRALDRFGFKGGAILEPGAGNGVFPGLMNSELSNNSIYTGIEYDAITGAILKHLQPDERILVESFVDSALPDDFYDVAIGNPPFSDAKILSDPRYKKHGFALHDYFFAKTMDKVKPGGLVIFVTSRYTMDKQSDKARQYLAERADLLGAIRLPETAFKKNAGTEVVTDILFLRKKVPGETFEGHPWLGLDKIKVKGGDHQINQYFSAHPEMVLGDGAIDKNGMYGANQYTVLPNKDTPIEAQLAAAIDRLPKDVFRPDAGTSAQAAQVREIDWNPKAKKEGNYYVGDNGKLMQVENRIGVQPKLRSKTDEVMIKDFVALRDAVSQAQYDQLNSGDWEKSLKALQKEYHAFVKKHGHILQHTLVERKETVVDEHTSEESEDVVTRRRFTLDSKLNDDPEYTKVRALESINDDTGAITQSDFLTKRTLDMRKEATINTPHDALLSSLNDIGKVDIPLIAERIGLTESEVIASLSTSIYESPSQGWQMADEYLSGNVKKKLKEVQEAAKTDRKYERNVQALLEAQPSPVPPSDITVSLGMNWIPAENYEQFLHEKTGVRAKVAYSEHTGTWSVSPISGHGSMAATADWGTPKRNAADILEAGLTGRPIRITETVGSGSDKKTQFDAPGTEAAIQKLKEMRAAFRDWLWQDAERTDKLVSLYNDKFNTTVSRKFDGRHLTLPGSSTTISVFDHVKRGAWRIIQTGNTYLAHSVGAGKTWAMVISAMEQKRLGLINKPMMVVPNHMLQQFAQEWLQLYPAARLMVADEKQFHTDNRRRFIARVSMSDLDGVIITHSAYKLLDLDPDFKQKIINEEIDYLGAALDEVQEAENDTTYADKQGKGKSRNPKVRDIQNRIEKMEEKLKAAMSGEGKDKSVRFDEMGVDMLYVDEAHEFRKLAFTTVRQMKGIDSSGSDRAFDLHMKARWLEQKHPGRSLVMASGTPITNTIAELYSVQRFMQPAELEERGLQDFDAWASMFGEENTEIEADASGKYAPVTRFANFVNVPELTQMFRNFADVLTSDSLAEMLGDKRPKVQNGSRTLEVTPQIDDYLEYKEVLATRLKASKLWKPSRDEPNNPDPVIRIIGDGRLAAIDMRFIDPTLPSDPNSKLNQLIDGVIRVYHETTNNEYNGKDGKVEPIKGGAQMVFSDLGFGAGVTEHRGFNARGWLEKRLRDAGIPVNHIAFMADHKKSDAKVKLFKDVNAGRVRILIGSSKNMGTGVNAQQRLIALHHLDTPWFPADLEQREGRIIRQGNKNPHVQIYAYSTKGSYDTNMWQLLARKQGFINQALSGDSSVRRMEDISEVSQFQMATAMTAGDERAIRLAGLKAEIDRYDRLFRAHEENRMRMKESFQLAGNTVTVSERVLPDAEKLAARVQDLSGDKFTAKAGGQVFDKRKEWGDALLAKIKDYTDQAKEGRAKVGELSGFQVDFVGAIDRSDSGKVIGYHARLEMPVGEDSVILARDALDDAVGMSIRATNALAALKQRPADLRQKIDGAKSKRNALEGRLDAKFQFTEEYAAKRREAEALEAEMLADSAKVAAGEEAQQASDKETDQGTTLLFSKASAHPENRAEQISLLEKKLDTTRADAESWYENDYRVNPDTGDLQRTPSLYSEAEKPVAGMSVDRAVRATAKLRASWHGFRRIHVVKSVKEVSNDLYLRSLRALKPIDQGTEGIYDPKTNTIWIIADNIGATETMTAEERLIWVAIHESAHAALRMLDKTVAEALDHAAKNSFVAKLSQAIAADRGETFNSRTHTDEAIAELAAATLTGKVDAILERYGVKVPVGMRSNLLGMIRRVVDAVRNFMAKMMGKPSTEVSNGEVLGMLRQMKDAVEGKATASQFEPAGAAMASTAPAQPSTKQKTTSDILRAPNKRGMESDTGMIDKAFRLPFKLIKWDRIVSKNADAILGKIGDLIPETVKAGIVSNYGLGPDYIDNKAEMQAREAAQNRKAHGMIEILAGLTRAESRVAYYWMQEQPGSVTEQHLLEQLPEASRETMAKLKKLISDLGKEAVRLGQMSQDSYERNNMAYLHRTYAKHVLAPDGWLGRYLQTRALKIKGNQYKGRGIFDEVPMSMIGGDTLHRKLQKGQADKQMVGEKVIRFERRDASTEAMEPLPGMTGKPMGKLREVIYWPASTPTPSKFGDWVNSGTFEVRDTKGDKLVVWRDLTREERERLGELDEVRYAVAQTLQMMVHDIEVGRFLEWTANKYGKVKPDGKEVSASESMLKAYSPDDWVHVPSSNIPGTQTKKYGTLGGLYVPGAIWNDIRQTAGGRIEPFGKTYASVLRFWKKSKTVWSPTVHMNNVMANFVMADWNDVRAVDLADALRVWALNDKTGYKELFQRFEDSGALGGMFQSNEVMRDEIKARLDELKADLTGEQDAAKEMGKMAKVLHLLSLVSVKPVKGSAELAAKAYQNEDAFFRLAVFLKAVRYGKNDIEAGRMARHAFLNYDINAPWIQMARQTFLPFISFFYRAAPMLLNTAKNKPWKIAKLVAFAYMVNALGYAMAGGGDDEDKDRKLMPPEKSGSVWGVVPKMIRMPWNHDDGSAVFLDIRRWVPVGDIVDMEMGAGTMPPWATPSGPLMTIAEAFLLNKSMFTEKEVVSDIDSLSEKTEKRLDYLFKSMMPNVPLPNPINMQLGGVGINPFNLDQGSFQSYSWSGIEKAVNRQENMIGEVKTTPAAIASAFGVKLAAYPRGNMEAAIALDFQRQSLEIQGKIKKIARDYSKLDAPTDAQTAAMERGIEAQKVKIEKAAEAMRERLD